MSDIKKLLDSYPYMTNMLYAIAGLVLIVVIFRFVRCIQNRCDLHKESKIEVEKKEEAHNEEVKLNQSSVSTSDIIWGSYCGHKLYHWFHKEK
jgi:hypothetical protein